MTARAKLTGIVLRLVDTGEADRVVTLLTRERGKVAAYARGARASRRRFGGSLEPFTLVTAEVRERSASELLGLDSVSPVAAQLERSRPKPHSASMASSKRTMCAAAPPASSKSSSVCSSIS